MTQKKHPSDLSDKFVVRMPEGMRDMIKVAADKSGRSMNAEICHRLKESLLVILDEAHSVNTPPKKQGLTFVPTPSVDVKALMESIADGDEKKVIGLISFARVSAEYYANVTELGEKLLENKKKEPDSPGLKNYKRKKHSSG